MAERDQFVLNAWERRIVIPLCRPGSEQGVLRIRTNHELNPRIRQQVLKEKDGL